tara:strand:+ start:24202 stop:25599 length:1398 start_codon:yes stop_codon:yes gene_type:complete
MAEARAYSLRDLSITLPKDGSRMASGDLAKQFRKDNKNTFDIRSIAAEFVWYESIDAPFCRLDVAIIESADFLNILRGGEIIHLELETDAAKGEKLKWDGQVFKIGAVTKAERTCSYILHCVSTESFNNEVNRIFGAFGPAAKSSENKQSLAKWAIEEQLKGGDKIKHPGAIEPCSKINFVSSNWRPVDFINYMCDKVTRSNAGRGSDTQSGFIFYENRKGFNFQSIDWLCEQQKLPYEYTYEQSNVGDSDTEKNYYLINNLAFPDRTNVLEKLRTGVIKNVTAGIMLPAITRSAIAMDTSGGGGGTITGPRESTFSGQFGKMSTLEKKNPLTYMKEYEEYFPTRAKLRILPGLKDQKEVDGKPAGDPNAGAATADADTLEVGTYAMSRYQMIRSVQLRIEVPGNTGVGAGDLIDVLIPLGKSDNGKVAEDKTYSGKYLVAGVSHTWTKDGVTTTLELTRDSVKK